MEKEQIKDILIRARKRISNRENWAQNAIAKDKNEKEVEAKSSEAVSWSIYGAICIESAVEDTKEVLFFLEKFLVKNGKRIPLYKFNNSFSHEEVIKLFNKAIEAI